MSLDKSLFSSSKSRNFINLRLFQNNNPNNKNILNLDKKRKNRYSNDYIKKSNYSKYKKYSLDMNTNKNNRVKFPKNNNKTKKANKNLKLNLNNNIQLNNNTTRESTLNSANSKGSQKTKLSINNKPSPKNENFSQEVENETNKKLKEPENDDIKFLYGIFYNYSQSINDDKSDQNKKINFNELRKYIIENEKTFKNEGNILIYQSTRSTGLNLDFYFIKKLENLIARYSLVIFIFIQNERLEQAREIFLLMLKENKIYIDYSDKKIIEYYSTKNRTINIAKEYPRMTYEVIRIYSFIIKYSQFFNMMNYRNIYLGRYFELLFFIYNFFVRKGNNRMFNLETKNQLSYWFSFALHNVTYFLISNYFPLNISIKLSNDIIRFYETFEDNNLTDLEKSLLIKTFYNLGLFHYLDGKKDEALMNLDKAKEKLINTEENDISDASFYQMNIKKKESINVLLPKIKKAETSFLNSSNMEENFLANGLSTTNSISENMINYNKNEENGKKENEKNKNQNIMIEKITQGFSKKKIDLEDIILLANYGVKNGMITEINKIENDYKHRFRKLFRGSHINLSTAFRVKDFLIPYYFNNPLIRKIELLMGEIELDKKNYISAYDHVLKAFYILISLKINRTSGNQKEFNNEQKIIDKYLTLIEKYKDEEIKNAEKEKSDQNILESNKNINSTNNSIGESFHIIKEENELLMDKYNLTNEEDEENNEGNQELLICGALSDYKVLKEIEKFFIFLNSLSLFQIKILNETQPENPKRNDLPILFPSQFKDCLSNIQRIELDNLQSMTLIRFIILKDPNKWIMPSNLNIGIITKKKYKEYEKNQIKKYQRERELNYVPITKTKEYKNFKKLFSSEKSNQEIKAFLNNNFKLVLKILRQSTEEEIKNIINFPYIIIETIKNFKKKEKKKISKLKNDGFAFCDNKEEDNNYLRYNRNNYDFDDYSPINNEKRFRTYSIKNRPNKKNYNLKEKQPKNSVDRFYVRNRSRNKSLFCKYVPNLKQPIEEESITDLKDYNDSYEDYLISPEYSIDKKL